MILSLPSIVFSVVLCMLSAEKPIVTHYAGHAAHDQSMYEKSNIFTKLII